VQNFAGATCTPGGRAGTALGAPATHPSLPITPQVCYVKYDRASAAALAMEALNGAVLNNGRGPKLKVLLAEAPAPR
jgi:hypothetical protein